MSRDSIFISYAREDKSSRDELLKHLGVILGEPPAVRVFADTSIDVGQEWSERIKEEMDRALVVVLLVSADFLISEYVKTIEIPKAALAAKRGDTTIACLYIRHCAASSFRIRVENGDGGDFEVGVSDYQGINDPEMPLMSLDKAADRERHYSLAADKIVRLAKKRLAKLQAEADREAKREARAAEEAKRKTRAAEEAKRKAPAGEEEERRQQDEADDKPEPPVDAVKTRRRWILWSVIALTGLLIAVAYFVYFSGPTGKEMRRARELADALASEIPRSRLQGTEIWYFTKRREAADLSVALSRLEAYGFRLLKQEPKNFLQTNSLWVGQEVSPDEAKLVAYTLIAAGVEIARVERFKDSIYRRPYRLIQIGAAPLLIGRPALRVNDIERAEGLPWSH